MQSSRVVPKLNDLIEDGDRITTIEAFDEDRGTWLRSGRDVCITDYTKDEEGVWRRNRPSLGGGLPASTPPPPWPPGAGANADTGKSLRDDADLTTASTPDLIVTYCKVMDSMSRTNNTSGLADLARYAGRLWWEMTGRGVEFK